MQDRGRPERRRRGDRGVVLVEFALVLNVIFALAFGVYEYAYAWRSAATVVSSSRSAARTASSLATDAQADYQALSSVRSDLQAGGLLDGLEYVVIYRSTTADGKVPASCTTGTSTIAPCNIYTGAQVRSMSAGSFSATTGCMSGTIAANYCPSTRNQIMSSADYVGVWVKVRHDYVTGLFGSGVDIKRSAVMRLEPRVS